MMTLPKKSVQSKAEHEVVMNMVELGGVASFGRSGFENVLVIFMKENTAEFPTLRLSIPPYKQMKDIHNFLRKDKSTPFRRFFLTHRPKERLVYSEQSEIKEIRKDLKVDPANNYVLLCYEQKTQANEEAPPPATAQPKKQDGGCTLM